MATIALGSTAAALGLAAAVTALKIQESHPTGSSVTLSVNPPAPVQAPAPAPAPAPVQAPAPAPAPDSNTLPAGWKRWTDPSTGHVYYQNNSTKTTQWKHPAPTVASKFAPLNPFSRKKTQRVQSDKPFVPIPLPGPPPTPYAPAPFVPIPLPGPPPTPYALPPAPAVAPAQAIDREAELDARLAPEPNPFLAENPPTEANPFQPNPFGPAPVVGVDREAEVQRQLQEADERRKSNPFAAPTAPHKVPPPPPFRPSQPPPPPPRAPPPVPVRRAAPGAPPRPPVPGIGPDFVEDDDDYVPVDPEEEAEEMAASAQRARSFVQSRRTPRNLGQPAPRNVTRRNLPPDPQVLIDARARAATAHARVAELRARADARAKSAVVPAPAPAPAPLPPVIAPPRVPEPSITDEEAVAHGQRIIAENNRIVAAAAASLAEQEAAEARRASRVGEAKANAVAVAKAAEASRLAREADPESTATTPVPVPEVESPVPVTPPAETTGQRWNRQAAETRARAEEIRAKAMSDASALAESTRATARAAAEATLARDAAAKLAAAKSWVPPPGFVVTGNLDEKDPKTLSFSYPPNTTFVDKKELRLAHFRQTFGLPDFQYPKKPYSPTDKVFMKKYEGIKLGGRRTYRRKRGSKISRRRK